MQTWRICLDFGTAFSKAAACPASDAPSFSSVRPLALGSVAQETSRYFAPCAVFVEEDRVLFGGAALASARARAEEGRAPLQSFKSMLGAVGALETLGLPAPAEVDPSRRLTRRQLTVAYLAWIQVLAATALTREHPAASWGNTVLRITRPAWSMHGPESGDWLVRRLVDEGRLVAQALGMKLLGSQGVDAASLVGALAEAETSHERSHVEACIYEPIAVAALVQNGRLTAAEEAWLVLDMGAGTTDIAGLVRTADGVREISGARVGLSIGGDDIDKIVLEHVLRGAGRLPVRMRTNFLRFLLTNVRDIKAELFRKGKASIAFEDRKYVVKRGDVEGDAGFTRIRTQIGEALGASLEGFVREHALQEGRLRILLAGGGSNLAFVQALASAAKPERGPRPKVQVFRPPVVLEGLGGDEEGAGIQLGVAVGGAFLALAPAEGRRAPVVV